mmetsp:Transcript_2193/g.5449  ORF Transcript_2193/g.5449 Transcript_2193/m.5449 type:complete len:231 (-) Transcript_2193:400-1092(-)
MSPPSSPLLPPPPPPRRLLSAVPVTSPRTSPLRSCSCLRMSECISCSCPICSLCCLSVDETSDSNAPLSLPSPFNTIPIGGNIPVGMARPTSLGTERCASLVTDFIGSVTIVRAGSCCLVIWLCGAICMRNRCLSRCDESDVIRSLNTADPCSATTSGSPTSNGSEFESCLTGRPFSYNSVACKGSSVSKIGISFTSTTATLSVKWRRLLTTNSSSGSPLSFVCVSILWT